MTTHWKQRPEGGGRLAMWLIRTIARRVGRAVARCLLWPISLYFLAVRGPERRSSRAYLQRALGRPATLRDVARHIHTFASTILDRVFMLSGQLSRFHIRTTGLADLHAVLDRGQGVLVFGSHLGSFDSLRVLATQRPDIQTRVLLDVKHNPALTRMLGALNPQVASTVIDAGQDGPSIVLAIKQAVDEGAMVALLVDRAKPGEPVQNVPFLGSDAPFPIAPWLIAATLRVPVVLAFGLYRGGNRYDLHFEVFSEGLAVDRHNRRERVAALVRDYAQRLERQVRDAPYNWFNFYDFWQADDATTPPQVVADRPDVRAAADRAVSARDAG